MRLYLRSELFKSEGKPAGAGSMRGGKYFARVQNGTDADGSPKYRYFESKEAYDAFLHGKERGESAKKLDTKVKEEHKESTEKQQKKPSLLSKDKDETAEKSLRLVVRIK